MEHFGKHRGTKGTGILLALALAAGYFFMKDGPIRLMALAAKSPLETFLSSVYEKEAAVSASGHPLLERASGLYTFSLFLEEEEEKLAKAQPDPAYQNLLGSEYLAEEGKSEQAAAGEILPGETDQEPDLEETEPEEIQPQMAATEITGTVYTPEQLADFEFLTSELFYVHKSTMATPEQLNAEALLGKDLTLPESDEPQVLLFHTHGSEGFSDSVKGDETMTVLGIGDYLEELLTEQYGIKVIHNREVFPYSDSYSMALDMINRTLAEYPSIQVTIDLHRDSGGHNVVDINGKPTAPIMFFNGMCQTPEGPLTDVENPYLMDNLAFNFQMKLKAEAYYPGFTLRTFLKAYRYNQHVLPRATLVEVGTENNTYEEARNAMEPLADLLYKVLRGK